MLINILVNKQIIGSVDYSMKKISFTDSTYKDFEFRIVEDFIYFIYLINGKRAYADVLARQSIEDDEFPSSLKDFKEACKYLKSYYENIAFT